MTTANIVVLRTEVVVYLGEVCLLISVVLVAERGLPVVSEVLVVRHLLNRRDEILPTVAVEYRELLVCELVVPLTLNLVECWCIYALNAGTLTKLIEWLCSL